LTSFRGSHERNERFTRVLGWVLAVVLYGAAYLLARTIYGPAVGFLVCTPILGAYGAWWLVHHGGSNTRHWLRWLALRKVSGNYHAFDDVAVRMEYRNGQCWVGAQDVFKVLRERFDTKACRRLEMSCGPEGFARDERGDWWFEGLALLRWLEKRSTGFDRRLNRFRLWLEREAFPPLRRKEGLEGPVSAP
jgi:hypothetical protein